MLVLRRRYAEFRGYLFFRRLPAEPLLALVDGSFDGFRALASIPGGPVHLSKAVHNSAAYAAFRVGLELDVKTFVKVVDRGEKPDDARRHQVVEADVGREALVNTAGNQTNLWQVLQHQGFAP